MRALAVLLALAAPMLAQATQARSASVEALTRGSDLVVRGRVQSVTPRWSEDGRRIFTFAEVRASSLWKGHAAGPVTVIVPGGVVGRIGQRVDGAPTFDEGEEVVVFLTRAEAGAFRVNGLAQGKFRVEGAVARPDLSRLTLVPRAPAVPAERRVEAMAVDELERRVRGARP